MSATKFKSCLATHISR